jgi:soluble lytic murein transglycosylase-like protein
MPLSRFLALCVGASLVSGCIQMSGNPAAGPAAEDDGGIAPEARTTPDKEMAEGAGAKSRAHELKEVIAQQARDNAVPIALAHAVIRIESNYNWKIVHAGNYGLMQIRLATARSLGFSGAPATLLDPSTNLHFGLKYLGDAYRDAGGDVCRAIMKYQGGHLAFRMTGANRQYCAKVKTLMASWS